MANGSCVALLALACCIHGCGGGGGETTDGSGSAELRAYNEIIQGPRRSALQRVPGALAAVPVPEPSELANFVRDRSAAIALGKTFFWDAQAGSDGRQACASCHFHAGADNRITNTVNPGFAKQFQIREPMATLRRSDFPFHRLLDPTQQDSRVVYDSDNAVGSQGVVRHHLNWIVAGSPVDSGTLTLDPLFQVRGVNVRQVTGRNVPTTINAVFNLRSFWDGRANFYFNGNNPFGARDPNAHVWVDDGDGPRTMQVLLDHASLASQAVGPPGSSVEMAFDGRTMPMLGRKLLSLRPLAQQRVHPADSILGPYAQPQGTGLKVAYQDLIKSAFAERYWRSTSATPDGVPLMEANFALFWGLAIQLYESTLVSDDSPFDRYASGNAAALTRSQQRGFSLFLNKGQCAQCHTGAEFTSATVSDSLTPDNLGQIVERMTMAGGRIALYDHGFYNIGLRPTEEDLGAGGNDPFGNPLSLAAQAASGKFIDPLVVPIDPCRFRVGPCVPISPADSVVAAGTFKTPSLRNIELTGPYMHNGGMATLREVLEFYNRHGNFREHNLDSFDPDIDFVANPFDVPGNFRFSEQELVDLESFLRSLTDERVRRQMAPFDHPELAVPNGPHLAPVGASGGPPIKEFIEGLR